MTTPSTAAEARGMTTVEIVDPAMCCSTGVCGSPANRR
ncbi:MAG: arsenic metallochaperone ArsD family protein [Cellulomonas sp.]|nr:arsenic metallochaperone ArsD family protein [Cellulomonas sp.]